MPKLTILANMKAKPDKIALVKTALEKLIAITRAVRQFKSGAQENNGRRWRQGLSRLAKCFAQYRIASKPNFD